MPVATKAGGAHPGGRREQGYVRQLVNCLFTAAYSLYLRGAMDRVVALTANQTKLDEFSMVFYNNLLSLPLLGGLMWAFGELERLPLEPALRNPAFLFAACASAALGFGISFTTLWCAATRSARRQALRWPGKACGPLLAGAA